MPPEADSAGQVRVGCSGWSYADWRGVVYPKGLPARRWFDWYAGHFDTVEINSTFYRLPADHPWLRTTDWTYVRFHGPRALGEPYHGRYTDRRLWRTARRLAAWRDEGCDVYAYFNNDVHGNAVHDATWLRDRLERERGPSGPAQPGAGS